ncbi:MAG: hypothetical protein AAFV53_16510 [Myxococcota bacterium]
MAIELKQVGTEWAIIDTDHPNRRPLERHGSKGHALKRLKRLRTIAQKSLDKRQGDQDGDAATQASGSGKPEQPSAADAAIKVALEGSVKTVLSAIEGITDADVLTRWGELEAAGADRPAITKAINTRLQGLSLDA